MSKEVHTIVVGGGFSGLSATLTLARRGLNPLLIEKSPRLGGMAACHERGCFSIERFYHHFFSHDDELLDLISAMGREEELLWGRTKMGFYAGERLWPFTTPADLLRFGHVRLADRIAFGLFTLGVRKKGRDEAALDGMSAGEWLTGRLGAKGYDSIMAPLIRSKFGVHMEDISAAFLLGRMKARVRSRRGAMMKECFGYFRHGLTGLLDDLGRLIEREGGEIRTGTPVREITAEGDHRFKISTLSGRTITCRNVIATAPLPVVASMAGSGLNIAGAASAFDYRGAVCLCFGMDRKLSDYYWINIASSSLPFGIVVEHTNLAPPADYGGERILYLASYCDRTSPLFKSKGEEIAATYFEGLKKVFPDFSKDEVKWWKVWRDPYATPVFTKNFGRRLQAFKETFPKGFVTAGNIDIYPGSRNVNSVIGSGRRAAETILEADGKG